MQFLSATLFRLRTLFHLSINERRTGSRRNRRHSGKTPLMVADNCTPFRNHLHIRPQNPSTILRTSIVIRSSFLIRIT
jgi:hypothetical protein